MARPKKQTVDYFPHYCDHGKTMYILEQRYGNDGYSFWFKLLEILGKSDGHFVNLNNLADWEYLQAKTLLSDDVCSEMLDLLAKLEAIDPELWEQKIVWSQNYVNGLLPVYSNRRADLPVKPDFYLQKPCSSDVSTCNLQAETHKGSKGSKEEVVEDVNNSDNSNLQEVIKAFNNNIHPITPMEAETFTAWLDDGVEAGLIVWAIKQSVINGKRNARYIDAIIKNLNKEGITTLAGAEAKERDRRDYKEKGKARESPKKPKLNPEEKQEIEKMNRQIAELEGRSPG